MLRKSLTYACIICVVYIIVVGYLGLAVRDDFFVLTFPSWPFLINCAENCGHKMLIALCINGIIIGFLTFTIISIALGTVMLTRKIDSSVLEGKRAEEAVTTLRTARHPPSQKKVRSSFIVTVVALLQGLLTVILFIVGLGLGLSVQEPLPPVLVLARWPCHGGVASNSDRTLSGVISTRHARSPRWHGLFPLREQGRQVCSVWRTRLAGRPGK